MAASLEMMRVVEGLQAPMAATNIMLPVLLVDMGDNRVGAVANTVAQVVESALVGTSYEAGMVSVKSTGPYIRELDVTVDSTGALPTRVEWNEASIARNERSKHETFFPCQALADPTCMPLALAAVVGLHMETEPARLSAMPGKWRTAEGEAATAEARRVAMRAADAARPWDDPRAVEALVDLVLTRITPDAPIVLLGDGAVSEALRARVPRLFTYTAAEVAAWKYEVGPWTPPHTTLSRDLETAVLAATTRALPPVGMMSFKVASCVATSNVAVRVEPFHSELVALVREHLVPRA
jgi:hypothetical protein